MKTAIIVGTRGSTLALRQTQSIIEQLRPLYPQYRFVVRSIRTRGDVRGEIPLPHLGGKGVFVKELENALSAGEIDIAVHSCKDLPVQLAPGLEIAAISRREDARDALISSKRVPLAELPPGSRLGTSSPRRALQIKAARPDLQITDLRGNIDTRLRKVEAGRIDAAVLAAAGLIRLGWEQWITEYLSPEICLPAAGQGALAVEVRENDIELKQMVSGVDHLETRQAVTAERVFLQGSGGGCHNPIAAFAIVRGSSLEIEGMIATADGKKQLRSQVKGAAREAERLGQLLAEELLAMGAGENMSQAGR